MKLPTLNKSEPDKENSFQSGLNREQPGLEGGFKGASRGLQGGFKEASRGFKGA